MNLSPVPFLKFFNSNGRPLVGGLLFTYIAGTSTKQATYTDESGVTPNTNPIVLDYRGEAQVWLDTSLTYKFVLAPAGDTDPPANPIKTTDDIAAPLTLVDFTSVIVGGILWPQSLMEAAEGVTPNTAYPYGAFRRYGMDPLGVSPAQAAFEIACSCNDYVYDDYPGGGTYLFTAQANVSQYPLRISGQQRGPIGPVDTPGTTFKLTAAAGVGAACISFTSFSDIEVSRIRFNLIASGGTLSQIGLQFGQLRASLIEKCSFFGPAISTDDTTGIKFLGTGTFTGGVVVRENYISNNQFGINVQGSVTDLMITGNEFYGTTGHASSIGVNFGNANNNGCIVVANSFDQLNRGIKSIGSGIKQVGNRFESADPQWEWVVGSATRHQSVGDTYIGGGVPIYSQLDAAGHQVFGAESFTSGQNFINTRSYFEGNGTSARTFAMGVPQDVTFAGGNYTGNGAMTLTAVSQSTLTYSMVGKTQFVWFSFSGTVGGTPNTTLQVAIPGGFTGGAHASEGGSCDIVDGGAAAVKSTCSVAAAGTVIRIFKSPAGGNWTAGSVTVTGQMMINCA